MKAYKLYFNEETGLVDYKEFDVRYETDFSNEPETNLYDAINSHNTSKRIVEEGVKQDECDIKSGKLEIRKCNVCGKYFYLYEGEKKWFVDRGLVPPKRCGECIMLNKHKYYKGNRAR